MTEIINIKCPEKIKYIEILAFNKVFIDSSLDKTGDLLQLSIIAPTWEIVGEHKIILNGNSTFGTLGKAGTRFHGDDGIPGLPGGPAGNFLGIAANFINSELLQISANGGQGGLGQNGGDGFTGSKGENPCADRFVEFSYERIDSDAFNSIEYGGYYKAYGRP